MGKSSNILLIADDKTIEEVLSLKLIFLRGIDSYTSITYEEAYGEIGHPEVILISCDENPENQERCLELIKHIKSNENLLCVSIILVLNKFDKEFLIRAYSEDISDFVLKDAEKGTILIRLMWALRQNTLIKDLKKRQAFLRDFGIVDDKTGFYLAKYREKVFDHEMKFFDLANKETSIMMIGASEEDKKSFDYKNIADVLKISLRSSDIIFHGLNEKIYVLLPDTPIGVVENVFKKITKTLINPKSVVGVATTVNGKNFGFIETSLTAHIGKAEYTPDNFLVVKETPADTNVDDLEGESWQHWINQNLGTQKNFKIFKAAYKKKLKNIIVPVFFHLQKKYEEKYFEVGVNQDIGENSSKFILTKDGNESELQINYNGFTKINVNVVHKGLDSPENQNYEIDLSQITEENVTKIVEDFINTFVEYYNKD